MAGLEGGNCSSVERKSRSCYISNGCNILCISYLLGRTHPPSARLEWGTSHVRALITPSIDDIDKDICAGAHLGGGTHFQASPSSRECLALPKWRANCIREGSSSWRFTRATNEWKCQIDCPSCTALPLWDAYVQRNRSPVPTSHLLDAECSTWQTFFNLSRKPPGFHPSSCRTDLLRIANEITAYTRVPCTG
jgi:hypothetical protein